LWLEDKIASRLGQLRPGIEATWKPTKAGICFFSLLRDKLAFVGLKVGF